MIYSKLQKSKHANVIEDFKIREQDQGIELTSSYSPEMKSKRLEQGIYNYKIPGGESGADVELRVELFLKNLFKRENSDNWPVNPIITTHSMTMRIMIKNLLGLSVEDFEMMESPKNGDIYILNRSSSSGRFILDKMYRPTYYTSPVNKFKWAPLEIK